jgi:hypothetical protein
MTCIGVNGKTKDIRYWISWYVTLAIENYLDCQSCSIYLMRSEVHGLQIQRSGFDSRRYQIVWELVGLEWGPLSLMSATEELLERKSSGSSLETCNYGRRDPSRWPHGTLYPQQLALTLPTSGGRSVGIVRSRNQATKFFLIPWINTLWTNYKALVVHSTATVLWRLCHWCFDCSTFSLYTCIRMDGSTVSVAATLHTCIRTA